MKTLLIIGASRGLGLALADEHLRRGWHVIATQRSDKASGLAALSKRYKESLEIEAVDINDPASLVALREKLAGRQIDLLFVNAGVTNDPHETVGEVTTDEFTRIMITNALSPMRAIEILQELVPVTGLIAVMSSGLGSVADNESGGWEVYRGSKAALNTFMRSFAARHAKDPRGFLIVAPGWVRTDMGGPEATLGIEESIPRIADLLERNAGKAGLRYLDYRGTVVRW